MIDVSDLPAVRAQLERDVEALKERHSQALAAKSAPQFVRAPAASGAQPDVARPPANQGSAR